MYHSYHTNVNIFLIFVQFQSIKSSTAVRRHVFSPENTEEKIQKEHVTRTAADANFDLSEDISNTTSGAATC